MTVFKTFWKIVKKYIGTILLYTILLIVFSGLNMTTSDNQATFVAVKPDVLIINEDEEIGITKNLIHYIEENANRISIKNEKDAINDALFYREVNFVIYIPKNYRNDILNKKNPILEIKKTGDYQSSFAEMMLSRYLQIQKLYATNSNQEEDLIKAINENLSKKSNIEVTSKIDTKKTENAAFYFNFASYSIMAVVIFVICLVLSSFHQKAVNKRGIISSMKVQKYNRQLLLASLIYAIIVWAIFVLLGILLIGDIPLLLLSIYMLNSFIFTFCALTLALLISTLVNNKNAINGIVNVVALGSAFLCGAFVPAKWLPDLVLQIAHVLPAYWYIHSNELLKTIEIINFETLKPLLVNMSVMVGFSILFIISNSIISKRKQKNVL